MARATQASTHTRLKNIRSNENTVFITVFLHTLERIAERISRHRARARVGRDFVPLSFLSKLTISQRFLSSNISRS